MHGKDFSNSTLTVQEKKYSEVGSSAVMICLQVGSIGIVPVIVISLAQVLIVLGFILRFRLSGFGKRGG